MAFTDKKGITVTSGFKYASKSPLDLRETVATLEDRDEYLTLGVTYNGMQVYVEENETLYIYHNTTGWTTLATGDDAATAAIPSGDIDIICS